MTLGFVSIDGVQYTVPVVESNRTVNTLDFYAIRTADGVLHRQLIGTYINYEVKFARPTRISQISAYASLWSAMAAAVAFHTCIMPDGYSFTAYIGDGVKDNIRRIRNANIFWQNLTASFIAQSPYATP